MIAFSSSEKRRFTIIMVFFAICIGAFAAVVSSDAVWADGESEPTEDSVASLEHDSTITYYDTLQGAIDA